MKKLNKDAIPDISQKYHEDIVALMPGHVYWKDKTGAFLGCNLQQAKDAGFGSPDEMIGKTDYDMPWHIQADYLQEIDRKIMKSERAVLIEEIFELPDGTRKIYLSNKLPLYDNENQVSGILGISFDITDRKKLEEELRKAKELAEAASHAKTEFLENMRHDIRTPLSGIIGFAEIIKREVKEPKIKEYTDNLMAASNTLLEFLNGILDAIKVLTGDIPILKRKFSLREVLEKMLRLLKPRAIEKKLEIKIYIDKKLPKYIIGDPVRIQRILLELLSNALNFTQKGYIAITIEVAKKQNHELIVKCVVQDTGIGIPGEKQDEIFVRFNRLTPSYEGIYKGAGLGLTVLKQFIDDIKGEIYCQSKIGEGSIFTCLFPLREALLDNAEDALEINMPVYVESELYRSIDRKIKRSEKESSQDKIRILIVEDQTLAAKVANSIITELDCLVDVVNDGFSALKYIDENCYDLIFMDIGLPNLSGYEVTKQIRAKEWKKDIHVPIVALTAHIDIENKQKCMESGMDAVLSKPLMRNTAADIINAFIPARKPVETEKYQVNQNDNINTILLSGPAVDLEAGAARVGNNKLAIDTIHLLIKGFQEDLPKFKAAKEKCDWPTLKALVHKHRGGSMYCGTPRFQQIAAHLEECLRLNKIEMLELVYQQFLMEMENICNEMELIKK